MSSNDLAIRIRGLGKAYTIRHNQESHSTLAEAALARLRHPLRRTQKQTFWALKDIDLDIHKGDVVGIIGRNGAGKSTLLKVLSRITSPTTGQIDLFGRVGSLLEVGTGFHPELTGRENIYLNGSILGMKKAEIDSQFDAIVDFAGVEQFLDTPVKRYSSGMAVRLAFAVAAHLRTEILIVDEVLAVGDAEFQEKCLGKMQDVAEGEGRTVLFVSHNMASIRNLCTRVVLLKGGRICKDGDPRKVSAEYLRQYERQATERPISWCGVCLDEIMLFDNDSGEATATCIFNHPYRLSVNISADPPLAKAAIVIRVFDDTGTLVSSLCSTEEGLPPFTIGERMQVDFELLPMQLYPGRYRVDVFVYRPNDPVTYLEANSQIGFEVVPEIVNGGMWPYTQEHGVTRIVQGASIRKLLSGREMTVGHGG